jgi:hypothetical protein
MRRTQLGQRLIAVLSYHFGPRSVVIVRSRSGRNFRFCGTIWSTSESVNIVASTTVCYREPFGFIVGHILFYPG